MVSDFTATLWHTTRRVERGDDFTRVNRVGEDNGSDEYRGLAVKIGGGRSTELIRTGELCIRIERDTVS